ncbi:MAG: hypothetical protein RI897_980 [Verrucomicrobiota bacterium]|jgi:hypothetical protein
MKTHCPPQLVLAGCLLFVTSAAASDLTVPAYTAYTLPDPNGARISERSGLTRWNDPNLNVNWYGLFRQTGPLRAGITLRLPADSTSLLGLAIDGQTNRFSVTGKGSENPVTVECGEFSLTSTGYHRITLSSYNAPGTPPGDISALHLAGQATENAHFNLKERRNAASVHLMYPVPEDTEIAAFYCEATAVEDPTTTFYMACGWHRGYFGMQVNSPSERRIIFSVWDSGSEAVDRDKVATENRVRLLAKGDGVYSGDFGNEGTGGHSHLKYPWKTGDTQKFLVTAQPTNQTFTAFSGYYFHPDSHQWMLISSWLAPKEGGYLKRPHSFSENFWGSNGHLPRKALYGNQWILTDQGRWIELTTAKFSHDQTGREDRLDRYMGIEQGQFFLQHGGFLDGFVTYGTAFDRPANGQHPDIQSLPGHP